MQNHDYITIAQEAKTSFIEKKSEFIGYLSPVTSNDEAVDFINTVKAEQRKARHHVYAYILRDSNITGVIFDLNSLPFSVILITFPCFTLSDCSFIIRPFSSKTEINLVRFDLSL